MSRGSRCLAALLASIVVSGTALAGPPPISSNDREVARDLVKRAIALSVAGDHAGAIDIYEQAYLLVPNALLLSNIGAEYQQDKKYADALRYFCMYLEKDPAGTNAPYAISQARLMQSALGITVTGDDVCAASKPKPSVAPAARPAQPAPETKPQEPSGNPTLRYVGLASGITGVVALGVGAYAGYKAKDFSDQVSNAVADARNGIPYPKNIRTLQRDGQNYEYVQIGFLIAGGVLAATGAVLYIVGRPDAPDHREQATVALTPTSHGIAMFGRF